MIVKALSLLLIVVVSTDALRCKICKPETCIDPVGCKGGFVRDVCNCCRRCAKVLNETCGGQWNLAGDCDKGLTCEIPVNAEGEEIDPYDNNPEGKCKQKKNKG